MNLPAITILLTTYIPPGEDGRKRKEAIRQAINSWAIHLRYDRPLGFVSSDDGSSEEDRDWLEAEIRETWADQLRPLQFIYRTYQYRRGYGASMNAGMERAFKESPLAFHAVDDWALKADFDLTPWAEVLLEPVYHIALVRLGPPHPGITGEVFMCAGGWFLKLDPHNFAFATRPFLMHRRFRSHYGPFQVGISALECERLYNEAYCWSHPRGGGPEIALALPHPWQHLDSIPLSDLEPGGEP